MVDGGDENGGEGRDLALGREMCTIYPDLHSTSVGLIELNTAAC